MLNQSNQKITCQQIRIISNERLAKDIYKMALASSLQALPGQFINIKIKDVYLRRPISISKIEKDYFEIIYKIVGKGTRILSTYQKDDYLDILLPLGNGFELVKNKQVLVIGGGIGIPPLLELIKQLSTNNKVTFLIGLNDIEEHIYQEYQPLVTTINKSVSFQGNVIDYLNNHHLEYDYAYACGPMPMLKALQNYLKVEGQISIEERMGCGFGACVGCTCQTKQHQYKRICVDGPVFRIGELDLDEY
ncbi:MAG: dihydroorotate dehydrogenase electron transfer subunit [Bacilli bacterium]|jgi:dihydroorotate dehydrogenase electron transfer subunit|nr:dihydroorotate dehydrogenase electron transfer subunit [Bacilli bacterium]